MSGSCGWFPMRRDDIRAWVSAHEEVLLADLAELSKYPMPFRTVIVASMTPERRLALWKQHLAIIAGDPNLSEDQRTFVIETSSRLPTLLAAPAPNPTIVAWEAEMAKVFPRAEAGRIFGTVGPPEPPEGLPLPPDALPH